jgi:hypothetical protein
MTPTIVMIQLFERELLQPILRHPSRAAADRAIVDHVRSIGVKSIVDVNSAIKFLQKHSVSVHITEIYKAK